MSSAYSDIVTSAFLRSHDVNTRKLLFELLTLTARTFVLSLLKFAESQGQGKGFFAVQTPEFVKRHTHRRIEMIEEKFYQGFLKVVVIGSGESRQRAILRIAVVSLHKRRRETKKGSDECSIPNSQF